MNTASGVNALYSNISGLGNTATGYVALASNTASNNTATGYAALTTNTDGSDNTANGFEALFLNKHGFGNTASGYQALYSNSTTINGVSGSYNTATGLQALQDNSSGSNNTADGYQALKSNTTANFNTADRYQALFKNTTGTNNTATGLQALYSNSGGSNNTAEGLKALQHCTGSNNIALGSSAGINLTMGSNNIDIANSGVAAEANTIRIGVVQTRTFIAGIRGKTTANANAVPVLIDSAGQLGTVSSSARFKKDIKPMDKASEGILALKPATFHYKSDSVNAPQFGLIAEDVARVNPDLVVRDDDGEIYTVRYDAVNAMLLNEFLKEHHKVQELEKQVEKLTAGLQKVSDQLELSKPAPQTVVNNNQ